MFRDRALYGCVRPNPALNTPRGRDAHYAPSRRGGNLWVSVSKPVAQSR